MWFKNLNAYRVKGLNMNASEISDALSKRLFTPCRPLEERQAGWISPFGDKNQNIVHSAQNCHIMCFKSEEKNIPASVVNEIVAERLEELKANDPSIKKVRKEIRQRITEEVRIELLPNAFSKVNRIMCYFDTEQNTLIINTSSQSKAENILLMLRSCLGEDVVFSPIQVKEDPTVKLSEWLLNGSNPSDIEFGKKCQLRDIEDLGTIRYAKHDMEDARLKKYLENGKTVSELEIEWEEQVVFVLTEDLVIKSIKFLDVVKEQFGDMQIETQEELFDAEFCVMISVFKKLLPFIIDCFGGEVEQEEEEE